MLYECGNFELVSGTLFLFFNLVALVGENDDLGLLLCFFLEIFCVLLMRCECGNFVWV